MERCIVGHGVTLAEGHYRDAVIVREDRAIPDHYARFGDLIVTNSRP
jgi:hypothetical protein